MRVILTFFLLIFTLALAGPPEVHAQNDTIIDGLKKKKNRESPCSRYWSGTMKYTMEPYLGVTIKRKGHKHTEYNATTGQKSTFKIKWDGSCKYTLIFKKSNLPSRFKKGWEVTYDIYECYEEFYEWEANIHGILYWGQVAKELTKGEKMAKEREAVMAAKKAHEDSVKTVKDILRKHKEDSIALAQGKQPLPSAAKSTPPEKGEKAEKGEKGSSRNAGEKEKKEKPDKEGKEGKEGKEKPAKAKKEKPEKEKKEKAPKQVKEKTPEEKKEKAPREKEEKAPKEKKEKTEKDE